MQSTLQAKHLGKRYRRDVWGLRDCTLTIPAGRVTALVGPNGAGKTTLLSLAAGFLEPTEGDIAVLGRSPQSSPRELRSAVGFVAQDHPLYRDFLVSEMMRLGRELNRRWSDTIFKTRMEMFGIPLRKRVAALSGGHQAQVALGMALAKEPRVLLLDEPAASLDPLARREFFGSIGNAGRSGPDVILSSHLIDDLEPICTYVILLAGSRVQLAGDAAELLGRHRLASTREEVAVFDARNDILIGNVISGHSTVTVFRLRDPSMQSHGTQIGLADLIIAYMGNPSSGTFAGPAGWNDQ